MRLREPFSRAVTAFSWAWTAGTGGKTLAGPVVMTDLANPDSFAVYKGRVRGAWVLSKPSTPVWNPDAPPPSPEDSARVTALHWERSQLSADTSAAAVRARRQWTIDLPYLLKAEGALGTLIDGAKEHALMTMSGSPNRAVAASEHGDLPRRLHAPGAAHRRRDHPAARGESREQAREPRRSSSGIRSARSGAASCPGEVVILGAHLDSWDLGTGLSDNGAGSIVVLEAARAIARSGVKPKRTIRFILFSGEEQGLLGSRAYAAAHAAEADSVQAVLVIDNGTGMIVGQALQGRDDLADTWKALLAPVESLGATTCGARSRVGTDHLSFASYGIPSFNFDQHPRGYFHTHHSQSDTFDKAVEGDLKQASAVMAATALELANLPTLLPRGPKPGPDVVPTKPSVGVAAGGR